MSLPPPPLPPHGPFKAWTNHDHEFILMPAIGLVLNSKIAYSTRNCVWANSQPAVTNGWLMAAPPPLPPGMAGRVLSTIAVKEMIPQIPGYGFHDGRVILLKIILPPSEWFWIVKPFVHLFNKTHRSGKQSPFPYSCLETLLGDRLLLLVLKGRTPVSVFKKNAKWRKSWRFSWNSSLVCFVSSKQIFFFDPQLCEVKHKLWEISLFIELFPFDLFWFHFQRIFRGKQRTVSEEDL